MFSMKTLFLLAGFFVSASYASTDNFLCYFGSWATYRPGDGEFEVENIDPFLCTHLVFSFAGVDESNHQIKILDPYYERCGDWELCAYGRFNDLKKQNPNLKTLLAVGGWNEGATKYTAMSSTYLNRKAFIDSSLAMLIEYGFDGLDMDWEYPGGRADSPGDPENDPANFVLLLEELRAAYDKALTDGLVSSRLLLTAAVSGGWQTIDKGYLIPQVSAPLDFINVMTYDYHGWFGGEFPYTGHNSPMYALEEELDENHDYYGWNTAYAMNYWLEGGAEREKLMLGIGTYGRGFRLTDANNNGLYAPASGPQAAGPYTRQAGILGFNEWCEIKDGYTVVRDSNVIAPYAYKGTDWLGYDDVDSVRYKAQYAKDQGFGGAFIWSVETDDFHGKCGLGINPLMNTIAETVRGDYTTVEPPTTQDTTKTTEEVDPTMPADPNAVCDGTHDMHVNPTDCTKYYYCLNDGQGGWDTVDGECPPGTVFDEPNQKCDYPANPDDPCPSNETTTQPPTDPPTTQGDNCAPEANEVCPFAGANALFDNLCNCSTYYQCEENEDGSWSLNTWECPPGTAFNPEASICDAPTSVPGCEPSRIVKV